MAMHIHIQGNLARDPEFHPYGDNNTGVRARLVIASERERGDVAEQLRTATKGDPVAVSGEGRQRRWTDGTGTEQFSYQFVGHETVWHPRTPTAANRAATNARSHTETVAVSPGR